MPDNMKARFLIVEGLKKLINSNPCIALLSLILLAAPTTGGLYDPVAYTFAAIFTAGSLAWLISKNRFVFPTKIPKVTGSLIMIFAVLYMTSSILAANKALAIQEAPKLILGLLVFFLASQIKNLQQLKIVAIAIIVGAVLCCILSIGLLNIDYIRNVVIIKGRFHGLFGYANALAIYLLVSWLMLVGLITDIKRKWWSIACFILTYTLIITGSRITAALWIVSAIVIAFLLQPRLRVLVITTSLAGALTAIASQHFLMYGNYYVALGCMVIMLSATVFLAEKVKNNNLGIMFWKGLTGAGICIVILLAFYSGHGNWGGFINRIQSASINSPELQERFAYYDDAVEIIKDYPLLGTGPGGWSSLQYKYQTAAYSVKWIHNEFLQVAVDNGLPALFVYLCLWAWLLYLLTSLIRSSQNQDDKFFLYSLFGTIMVVILQSTLDLSLTFPAVKNIFWLLLGAAGAIWTNQTNLRIAGKWVTSCVLIAVSLTLIPLFIAAIYEKQALNLYSSGNLYKAQLAAEKGLTLNPLDAKLYNLMGNIGEEMAIASKDRKKLIMPIKNYEKAIHYDNNNPEYYANLAYSYFQYGNVEKSCTLYRLLVENNPLKQSNWDNYAFGLVTLEEQQLRRGDIVSAKKTQQELEGIPLKIEQYLRNLSPRALKLKHKPELGVSDVIKDSIIRARWLLNC